MAEVVAGANITILGLSGVVVQVVVGLEVKRLALAPPTVFREQQIRAVAVAAEAVAAERLAGLVARAL